MKGSASRPSSATMKGTRCAISPETKATSRESRSSLETRTLQRALRAAARAAASCGRRSRVGALAGFRLDVFGDDLQSFRLREAPGITNGRVFRRAEDSNEVVILRNVADVAKARTWLGSDETKVAMGKSGVVGSPNVRFAAAGVIRAK
jgi:hypothetical protein